MSQSAAQPISDDHSDLRRRWLELWQRSGIPPQRVADIGPLLAAYESPGRHYHNLTHIRHCLAELDSAALLADDPVAIEFAIWFHDAVYDPTRHDNEERSAELMASTLGGAGLARSMVERVNGLILATKHLQPPGDSDERFLVDIDLSILGRPAGEFDQYERAIRLEYQHVPADAFAAGRAALLRRFLERPQIYQTPLFEDRYEARARENIRRSIESLVGK